MAKLRNGNRDVWVIYSAETGMTLGTIRKHEGLGYQVYVPSRVAASGEIPQGQPHPTLEAAEADLRSFH